MDTCSHDFVQSPLYLMRATTWEQPTFYAPSGTLPVEYCKECGLLRLSADALKEINNLPEAPKFIQIMDENRFVTGDGKVIIKAENLPPDFLGTGNQWLPSRRNEPTPEE